MRWLGRALMVVILVAGASAREARACMWDKDTLRQEASGVPEPLLVLLGGFPINPPLYYEMRLKRSAASIAKSPEKLEAYDDAAVSCDRLGKQDEAIAWMAKKNKAMIATGYKGGDPPDHWYRYHANLGTFYVHRWVKAGANLDQLADLKKGRDLVKKAIDDNPKAHFGREKYQLMAVEWLLSRPTVKPHDTVLPSFLSRSEQTMEAIVGVSGLMALGAAWQSFDVTYALYAALLRVDLNYIAWVARRRLVKLGLDKTLIAGVPEDPKSRAKLIPRAMVESNREPVFAFFRARSEATAWQKRRSEYLVPRLEAGRHPDDDESFWADFDGDPWRAKLTATSPTKPKKAKTADNGKPPNHQDDADRPGDATTGDGAEQPAMPTSAPGEVPPNQHSSCACEVTTSPPSPTGFVWLALPLLAGLRRSRGRAA